MTIIPNRYCQRLGIPVPRFEAVAGRPDVTLFQLVVMALLERGGPMSMDEIAARLDRAALPARLARRDFVVAVEKAWHGQPPLVRDGDEHLALDLLSSEFRHIAFVAGLRRSVAPRPTPVDSHVPKEDDEPLSQDEVTAAFSGRSLEVYSSIRRAAAVLEAWGSPQPKRLRDVAGRLAAEARALCLLYEYGALHGGVRVRARPDDRLLPVEWGCAAIPTCTRCSMRRCARVSQ